MDEDRQGILGYVRDLAVSVTLVGMLAVPLFGFGVNIWHGIKIEEKLEEVPTRTQRIRFARNYLREHAKADPITRYCETVSCGFLRNYLDNRR
jgi:hypothetical protein